ncbi:hypothetical protein D7Y41_11985 [Anaerotruncus sp. 1XD22-93]|nr:hypothetical protein D7Y41_11985 [Anaerotruncus sp. 1XD22-93]
MISEKTVLFVARQPETSRQPVLKSVPLAWTGMQMGNKNKRSSAGMPEASQRSCTLVFSGLQPALLLD